MTDIATLLVENAIKDDRKEIAKKALQKGATIAFVQEITDLEIEVIEKIKEELNK